MTHGARIAVTLGPSDDLRAEVFVRPADDTAAGGAIVGTITGPRRGRDITLPSTTRFVPLPGGSGGGGVSRAILTEPAFWTPDLPNLYRVEGRVGLAADAAVVDGWIGLRRLGVRGRSFWLDGRRWVPRAAGGGIDLTAAREAAVGVIVDSPDDPLLAQADEAGVAVVAVLRGAGEIRAQVAALACHPSAMLAILPADVAAAETLQAIRRVKGTLQVGVEMDGGLPPAEVPAGVDFVVLALVDERPPHEGWRRPPAQPLVAWRPGAAGARASCDALQGALARWGTAGGGSESAWDWAGYLVGPPESPRTLQR